MTDRPVTPRLGVEGSAFAKKLGVVCDCVETDRAVYSMPFREDNVTVGDIVHGGAISSLADIAATGAAWSAVTEPEKYRGITIDLSLSFIAAARADSVTADAHVVKRGGTVCFIDVELRASDGALVATCKVVYKLSRIETPMEKLTALFTGKDAGEQKVLLAQLERSGAGLYRAFAAKEADPDNRRALLDAAEREEMNAATLERLLQRHSGA